VVRGYTDYEELIDYDLKVILDKKADKNRSENKEPQSAQTYYEQLKRVELPYPVSGLDKPTSGVLIFALDSKTTKLLSEAFREHRVKKEYC
jgi:23S rRNA-/tRNA-specific pseudouridylate synthase